MSQKKKGKGESSLCTGVELENSPELQLGMLSLNFMRWPSKVS